MAAPSDDKNLALYCDFENIALGVRDANYQKFDIRHILERLLVKGSIVVKKAYCDWDRYKNFKGPMHEAAFELIEIPHVRMSGKNSADIRMVVDALDLCYTKSHVDTFVIISGDSDFSPLVSKLRENAKTVIGVGVKNSTSDLLIRSCDEFIYYDDLVREIERSRRPTKTRASKKRSSRSKTEVGVEVRIGDGGGARTVASDALVVEIDAPPRTPAAATEPSSSPDATAAAEATAADADATGDEATGEATTGKGRGKKRTSAKKSASKKATAKKRASRKKGGADEAGASGDGADAEGADAASVDGTAASETATGEGTSGGEPAADEAGGASAAGGTDEDGAGGGQVAGRAKRAGTSRSRRGRRGGSGTDADVDGSTGTDETLAAAEDDIGTDEVEMVDEEGAVDDGAPDERAQEGLDVLLETALALSSERGGADKLWGSMIKQTLKRRRPGFNESYYGFDSFGKMLEEAEARGYLSLEHDDRSGGYIITDIGT